MNLQKFKAFLINKKNYLIAVLAILIILILSGIYLINSIKTKEVTEKTWQLELTYNQTSQKLILDKLNLINGQYIPDQRNSLYSPYKLEVLDSKGKVIYSAKINITEQILYDFFPNATAGSSLTENAKSVIFVPFQNTASKMIILRNNKNVLEVNLPGLTSYNFVQSADAASKSISCGPVTTVFINDNYTNIDRFKTDVSYLENLYNTTPPYNVNPSIFDFKEVDSSQNFGCATSGIKACIENKLTAIKSSGLRYYPSAQKFIVLVDNPNALSVDGGLAGLVNGVGGDVIIYTNFVYPGPTGGKPFAAASHELEGHAIGYLWDRYVSSDSNYSVIPSGYPQSNCSVNSSGEGFWPLAGSTGIYKGCANTNQYAPFPLTCQSFTKSLISGGTNDTIMSAIGCAPNEFDSVEKSWITNNILPFYKPCSGGPQSTITPTPTPAVSPTPTPTPTPTPAPIIHSVTGTAFIDSNNNGQKDPGESAFPNLSVNLSGLYSGTSVTDFSGNYTFGNLPVGNYSISAKSTYYNLSFGSKSFTITQNTIGYTINFPIPPSALNTPTPTPAPLENPTPTPAPSSQPFPTITANQATPTPVPVNPSATYTCVFDPSCVTGQSSIQICPLKCTPNP